MLQKNSMYLCKQMGKFENAAQENVRIEACTYLKIDSITSTLVCMKMEWSNGSY